MTVIFIEQFLPSTQNILVIISSVELQSLAVSCVFTRDLDLVVLHAKLLRVGGHLEVHIVFLHVAFGDQVEVDVANVLNLNFQLTLGGAERTALEEEPGEDGEDIVSDDEGK